MSGYIYGLFWNSGYENFDFVYTDKNQEKNTIMNTSNIDKIISNELVNLNNIEINNIQIDNLIDIFCKLPFESLTINKCKINSIENLKLNKSCKKIIIIDTYINNYESLQEMNIEYIKIQNSNIKLDFLNNCKQLREIIYKNNHIENIPSLSNLKNLYSLILSNNKIKNISELKLLVNLQILDLSNNDIDNIEVLQYLKNIRYLYIDNNNINNINFLEDLDKIKYFNISSNNIKNIDVIINFKDLEGLNIKNNKIQNLPNLLNFNKLDYNNINIDWDIINSVNGMKGYLLIKNIIQSLKS